MDAGSLSVAVVPSARDFTERMRSALLPQADLLGREVGDRLKLGIESKLSDVRVGVKADTALANTELDRTRAKAAELGRQRENIKVDVQNSGSVMGWLVSAVAAATAIAPAFAVAGVGIGAFAALAIPALRNVARYEQQVSSGSAKAAQTWAKMTTTQQQVVVGLHALGTEFHAAEAQIDPEILHVFNIALGQAEQILPEVIPLARAGGAALGGLINQIGAAFTDSQAQQFFAFVEHNLGPDTQQIGTTVVDLIHTVFNLIQGLQPTSLALLHVLSGVADTLSWLSGHAPVLTSTILLAIALAKPLQLIAGLNLAEKFSSWGDKLTVLPSKFQALAQSAVAAESVQRGMAGAEAATAGFAVASDGAVTAVVGLTRAQKGLAIATAALDAINPLGWVAIATGAVFGLYEAVSHLDKQNDNVTQSLIKQDRAVGFNIAGYQKFATQLKGFSTEAGGWVGSFIGSISQAITAGAHALDMNLYNIQAALGVTRSGAEKMAQEAGVSAKALSQTGVSGREAASRVIAYGNAADQVTGQTRVLTQAMQQLTNAMNMQINPLLTLEGDEVSWKQAQQAATQAINQNKNALDGNSASALNARQAIISATSSVVKFADDQLTLHGNLGQASKAIQDQIHWLEQHAGKSKIAKDEIDALRKTEAEIKAQIKSQISITGQGSWNIQGLPGSLSAHIHGAGGFARGGIVGGTDYGIDSQIALVRPGEAIAPVEAVPAIAPILKAYGVPGFASGGIVPSYSGSVPGETTWLSNNYANSIHGMASSLAASLQQALASSSPPGGSFPASSGSAAVAQAFARGLLASHGWGMDQWPPLLALWNRESGWNQNAQNPSSGAAGIPQDITGNFHGGYRGQVIWGEDYIAGRYGTPSGAWAHEVAFGWYDHGGKMGPGWNISYNGTGRPEHVFTDSQLHMIAAAAEGGGGRSTSYHAHFDGASTQALQSTVQMTFRSMEMQAAMKERVGRRR